MYYSASERKKCGIAGREPCCNAREYRADHIAEAEPGHVDDERECLHGRREALFHLSEYPNNILHGKRRRRRAWDKASWENHQTVVTILVIACRTGIQMKK